MSTERTPAPARDFRWYRRRTLRAAIVVLSGLLLFYSKLTFDLTPWAQAVTSAATTWRYGDEGHLSTRVLLFTEDDLQYGQYRFPIPYDVHARLLEVLNEPRFRPSALFIDFAFIQPHRADDVQYNKLNTAVCELAKAMPVFVVDNRTYSGTEHLAAPFGGCARRVGAFLNDDEPGAGTVSYPVCGAPPPNEQKGVFDKIRALFLPDHEGCHGPYSAAFAMRKWRTLDPDATAGPDVLADDRIALSWPARFIPQPLCSSDGRSALGAAIADLYIEGAESLKRRCPYHLTVSAGQLLNPEEGAKALTVDLQNRVVFYGAKIGVSGDRINTPVYKDLAGVYYHAMAYDNLVTFADHPKHETPHWLKNLIALILSLSAIYTVFRRSSHAEAKTPTQTLQAYAIAWRAFFVFAVTTVFLAWLFNDHAPEYLLLIAFGLYLVLRGLTELATALKSVGCFLFALVAYFFFSTSIDIFFSMILFLEGVHLMQHHLGQAAEQVNEIVDRRTHPWWHAERIVSMLLDPFKPD